MNFACSGKKGDLIMALYVVRALGGGGLYLRHGEFEEPLEGVLESCGQLVSTQKYINEFRVHRDEPIDIDLDIFRRSLLLHRRTLLEVMCVAHGLPIPNPSTFLPWIDAPGDTKFSEKIVIHRRAVIKSRAPNKYFDWGRLIRHFGKEKFVFVSRLESEWQDFGMPEIEYYCPFDNFEHARIIKGCRLFVGNQSFPAALADSLGVDRIFELANTPQRKHFAVRYAQNAWYYASDWDRTLFGFRFGRCVLGDQYRDLVSGEILNGLNSTFFPSPSHLVRELSFYFGYATRLTERYLRHSLGILK